MIQDERRLKDIDLEELIVRAKGGTLPLGRGANLLELKRWLGYLIGQAEDLVRSAVTDNRALKQDEDRAVGQFVDGAEELRVMIEELEAAFRKEVSDPANLIPISPRYI